MEINETIFADENLLQVTINNRTPVSLTDLTLSLLAISQQYESFIENSFPSDERPSTELLIKEVRSGSIILELIANAMPFIPLLWTGGSLLEWASNAKDIALWLQGKLADKPQDLSKSDLKQWNSIIEPIAKDNGSQLNLSVTGNGNTVNLLTVSSNEAVRMQNRIKKEIGKIEEPQESTYTKRRNSTLIQTLATGQRSNLLAQNHCEFYSRTTPLWKRCSRRGTSFPGRGSTSPTSWTSRFRP